MGLVVGVGLALPLLYSRDVPQGTASRTLTLQMALLLECKRFGYGKPYPYWIVGVWLLKLTVLLGQAPELQSELRIAATAEQAGHYEEAATLYQRLLLSIPDSSQADPSLVVHVRTRLATDYYLLHRYRESLEAVAPLTAKGSRYNHLPAQAWLVQGLDCLELGQLPEAMASLRRTLELNPDSGTARLALGDVLARSGRIHEAVKEYEEQTERTPSLPDAWYKLGL